VGGGGVLFWGKFLVFKNFFLGKGTKGFVWSVRPFSGMESAPNGTDFNENLKFEFFFF